MVNVLALPAAAGDQPLYLKRLKGRALCPLSAARRRPRAADHIVGQAAEAGGPASLPAKCWLTKIINKGVKNFA